MEVTRKSQFSNITRTKDLPITHEQLARLDKGEYAFQVCPEVSKDDQEWLDSGMTPDEFLKSIDSGHRYDK